MSALYRRTTVFAWVPTMVVSYDTIVAKRLPEYFKQVPQARTFFTDDLLALCELPVMQLVYKLIDEKTNRNFLLNYFNWKAVELSPDEVDPINICNKVYDTTISLCTSTKRDILKTVSMEDLMTSIGKSFKVLTKDDALDIIYLYLGPRYPNGMEALLRSFYGGTNKIQLLRGTNLFLKSFLQKHICDSYFFEDTSDIEKYAKRRHDNLSEVLVPGNRVNLSIVDEIEGTRLRDLILDEPVEDYRKKYNLDIHILNLPI